MAFFIDRLFFSPGISPFLLSLIAALLTIVPYVGAVVGGLIPFLIALLTMNSFGSSMAVLAVIVLVQAIDNYFVEPFVIGGEVNLSAFTTIISIFAGGVMWGVAGMILFIPLFAMIKIVCSEIEPLKPVAELLGDQAKGRQSERMISWIKKKLGKKEGKN